MHPLDTLLIDAPRMDALPDAAKPLLSWYDANARKLPWRDDPSPYRVWISEIMLQQTRVEAVKGYFARFLAALPDVEALANVEDDVLLKLWEGLGYYNRARNLKKAAIMIQRNFDGKFPASYGALLSLPGVGEYTAGAVASIAFGIPVPAVDGNVLRVLSRLTLSYADITLPQVKEAWRKTIPVMQPPARPGDFNQALMELGAMVCLPNAAPKCLECPVSAHCAACQAGCPLELPVKTGKKPRRIEQRTVVLVVAEGKVLLFRRGDKLLSGMYEPLNLMGSLGTDGVMEAVTELGGHGDTVLPLTRSKHLFTHIEWQMEGYLVHTTPFFPQENAVWADRSSLAEDYALPSAFRAYTRQLPELLARCEE